MMRLLLLIAILSCHVTILLGQSPGNVSGNLLIWLKANSNVYEGNGSDNAEDGDGVQFWDNLAGGNDAVNATSTRRPIFRTGIINGYSALEFNATKYLDTEAESGILQNESFIIFLVFKQNSFVGGGNDAEGTFIIDRPTATNNLTTFKMINTDKYFYQRRDNSGNNLGGPISVTPANTTSFVIADYYRETDATDEGIFLNGKLEIDQDGNNDNITGPVIRIGNHATNIDTGGLNGYFAEMVVYNTELSDTDRRKVESYLAIKYGITLDQTTATNYVRSNGSTIYSAATFAGYLSDVAGIGRDDNTDLSQTSSKSQNTNSVITIFNPSNLNANNEFLVWGSNNGSLTTPNTSDVQSPIVRRLSRVWRTAEPNGNIGTVTVDVDLNAVPGTINSSHLRLIVDANGTFSGGNTLYSVSSTPATRVYRFTGVTLDDGNYFTIGSTNASTTPLPIELTNFNVTYESPAVVASWETASELNNDYFTLERAGTDLAFEEIGTKPGAGTSKIPHAYSMIDSNPYEGRSYYRLKQTDFDGTATYSDTKFMFIEESEKKLAVFPNPNDGKKLRFTWGNAKFNLDHVEVINQQGQLIESSHTEVQDLREYSMDLKQRLAPGFYIVKVHYNGKDEFVKLIVR